MRDTRARRIDRLDPLEVPIVVGDDDAVLAGGDGADALTGGAGRDVFVFAPDGSGAPTALDEAIADLAPGEDRIDLRAFHIGGFDALAGLLEADGGDIWLRLGDVGGRDVRLDDVNILELNESDFLL